jgi:hypothetical protein
VYGEIQKNVIKSLHLYRLLGYCAFLFWKLECSQADSVNQLRKNTKFKEYMENFNYQPSTGIAWIKFYQFVCDYPLFLRCKNLHYTKLSGMMSGITHHLGKDENMEMKAFFRKTT